MNQEIAKVVDVLYHGEYAGMLCKNHAAKLEKEGKGYFDNYCTFVIDDEVNWYEERERFRLTGERKKYRWEEQEQFSLSKRQ
ncbi:MAG: hypothetical protein WCE94_04555 [Candidatus Methanoperedens sp.]